MSRSACFTTVLVAACLLITGVIRPPAARAEDPGSSVRLPEGVYLELSRDFYEALRHNAGRSATVYTNDPADRYLREIAVSTRFMVQTNLEILKQQEAMIQLLRSLLEKK